MNSFLPERADTGPAAGAKAQLRKELIVNRSLPTRSLPEHPHLDQLRRQAKELLQAFIAGEKRAVTEVNAHYYSADPAKFALHDAQLVLARAYGFDSWPRLKAHADGVTLKRLIDAVRADDLTEVRAMLNVRPELAHMSMDNLQVLHHAVLNRSSEMVRILMQNGANSREGVYPHRDATAPLTIASERGYDEIVAIIREEERRRRQSRSGVARTPAPDELFRAIQSGNDARAITMLAADPLLVRTSSIEGWTPLHVAARALNTTIVASLLDNGADAGVRGPHDATPLDVAAHFSDANHSQEFVKVASLLLARGAVLTPSAAVALGETDWLRARHADGTLTNPIDGITGGLLRIAASHNRPDVLSLLLDFGFDPDERTRFGGGDEDNVVFTWGMPLWHCAANGKYDMAEMLLKRGADSNASVYASGDPVSQAYGKRDWKMVKLLEHMKPEERVSFATALLDAGARTDLRDNLLKSTPLGWACRWGRIELVKLLLDRGADPVEPDAESWATPEAWAQKMGHRHTMTVLEEHGD
jgi:ankyrin repeat protein